MASVAVICLSADWLVESFFKIEPASQEKTVKALYFVSLIVFVLMQNQIFSSVLQGIHRFDAYSKILNLNNFLLLAGNLLLVTSGYGLLSLFVCNLVVSIFSGIFYAVFAKRNLAEFKLTLKFTKADIKLILFFSAGVIGAQILGNFIILFERSWITRQLGAESLTYYVVPLVLAFYIHGFVFSFITVIFPLASELKNENEKLLRLYIKATKIVCLFVFFFATSLITEGGFFLTLWMGTDFADKSYALLVIQTITFSLLAIQTISWQLTDGLGFSNHNFYLLIICLLVTISLMMLLVKDFGAIGVAVGRLSGIAFVFLSIFYVEKWIFFKVQKKFWLNLILVLTTASAAAAAVEKLIVSNFSSGWLVFGSATSLGGICYIFFVWLLNFVSEDEKQLVRTVLKLQPKS